MPRVHTFNFVSLKRCEQPYRSSLRATVANQHHRWARAAIEETDVAKTMYENTWLVLIFFWRSPLYNYLFYFVTVYKSFHSKALLIGTTKVLQKNPTWRPYTIYHLQCGKHASPSVTFTLNCLVRFTPLTDVMNNPGRPLMQPLKRGHLTLFYNSTHTQKQKKWYKATALMPHPTLYCFLHTSINLHLKRNVFQPAITHIEPNTEVTLYVIYFKYLTFFRTHQPDWKLTLFTLFSYHWIESLTYVT